jgi:hypothetical protein
MTKWSEEMDSFQVIGAREVRKSVVGKGKGEDYEEVGP